MYRSDLDAAHQRIAALEAQLQTLAPRPRSPAEVGDLTLADRDALRKERAATMRAGARRSDESARRSVVLAIAAVWIVTFAGFKLLFTIGAIMLAVFSFFASLAWAILNALFRNQVSMSDGPSTEHGAIGFWIALALVDTAISLGIVVVDRRSRERKRKALELQLAELEA